MLNKHNYIKNTRSIMKQIILGSNLVSISWILFQLNKYSFLSKINKIPILNSNLWLFWHLPLFFLGFFLNLNYLILFWLVYIFIDCFFYSVPGYLATYEYLKSHYVFFINDRSFFLISNIIFGTFIPNLFLLMSFLLNYRYVNSKRIFIFGFLIIILQSISRICNGYLNYWDIIKITFYQYNYVYSDKFMNIVICCFNIIPVIFNVTINCLFFSLLYKKIQNIYYEII
ncbi:MULTISPECIES: hypothetical protein [Candidatus Phytoplasma]|uniref:Integral membrane protein n=2 Tax=Candidatus Phytoplasma TaxID=33926 RepID=A0ABN0J870_PEWBP|nr:MULTISPECIES: hypothetical protein [Phytoplasma]QLL36719.1 hypothetical protein EPWB_v2c0840 ['Echinacea purpurea' witches'-broom phytoplasma]WEX20207.1 MAG: hypothetical protein TB2022_0960 [Candidatus Phytoplasma aurantifolia]WKV63963.1 MAG: hypothetical protein NCHU2022_c0850 [Candidatus Phytoplasma australasiaticum]EMR14644.1 hypothetical protein PNWB_v1c2440 [Peanut witches'-broom phytoplasma NTU2011]MDO8052849.1 hypothetical protein ['Vigna radiata' phytoplasma]